MIGIIAIRSPCVCPHSVTHFSWSSVCGWAVQYLHVWISAPAPKLSDSSAWTIRALQRSHPGKAAHKCSVGRGVRHGRTFPSLITTPTGLNESRLLKRFALLVLMCLWSNEWSGPSVLAHYLDTEPALRCGRLFSSDKTGVLHVWCHFKAYSAKKVMLLLFGNLVSPNFDDVCETMHEKSTFWGYVVFP